MNKDIETNVIYKDGRRISHKCAICGKEMLPCSPKKKYCKPSCQKVGRYNLHNNTNFKTVKQCEKHLYTINKTYRGRIENKPVMKFSLKGTYIGTIPSVCMAGKMGDDNGNYDKNSIARCARGERNTYRGYIWIYKEDFTEEVLQQRLDKADNRFKFLEKPVVVFDEDGNYVARYNSITEGAEKEFVDRSSLIGHLKRKKKHNTCAGMIWYYEDALQQQQYKIS